LVDLANFSTAEKSRTGAEMPVCDFGSTEQLTHKAEGDEKSRGMFLKLLGPESEDTRRALMQVQKRAEKNKDNHSPSDEEQAAELESDSKMLAKLTVGGLVFYKGKWWDVDADNAAELYSGLFLLRTQALKFILDAGNFTKV